MPIINLQKRLQECGRIRLGRQMETRSGRKYPAALDTFRLTSRDRDRINEAAKLYGGTVTAWEGPSGSEWEVITAASKLPVVVPPTAMAFSQNYELWAAGGCQRRCTGAIEPEIDWEHAESISSGPCLCDPENRQCEPHTRLSVMLRDLSGLGLWRLDSTGYYAAIELQGAVEIIGLAAGRGQMLPATLRLDPRMIKREGEQTKRFVVPVLDIDVSPAQLLMGTVGVAPEQMTQPEGAPAALTPVPEGAPPPSIADQVAASDALPSRRRASTPAIRSTGIAPRTAAQRNQERPRADTSDEPPVQSEEEAYAAMEAARDAAEATQDPPRMATHGQLTKLGVVLTTLGFVKGPTYDTTEDARLARLQFCSNKIRELLPDVPWSGRTITSSKQFTFDEANKLINALEQMEAGDNPGPVVEQPGDDMTQEPVDAVVETGWG